eukprot:1148607-Pelagomonas_calceolata.AAC.19
MSRSRSRIVMKHAHIITVMIVWQVKEVVNGIYTVEVNAVKWGKLHSTYGCRYKQSTVVLEVTTARWEIRHSTACSTNQVELTFLVPL